MDIMSIIVIVSVAVFLLGSIWLMERSNKYNENDQNKK